MGSQFLNLARSAGEVDVRNRYLTIAQHYRTLRRRRNETRPGMLPRDVCDATETDQRTSPGIRLTIRTRVLQQWPEDEIAQRVMNLRIISARL